MHPARRTFLCALLATFSAVASLRAASPAATQNTDPGSQFPPTPAPDGWTVAWHAPTLPALIAQTKPVLTFPTIHGDLLFLWTGTGKTGVRWFRFATARRMSAAPHAAPEWAVLRSDDPFIEDGHGWLPIREVAVQGAPGKREGMGAAPWSCVVAADPAHGTLFETEYYFQAEGEAARSYRMLVLQDEKNHWHYVVSTDGNFWDDIGNVDHTDIAAAFTGLPNQPLDIHIAWHSGTFDHDTGKSKLLWNLNTHCAGKLPMDVNTPVDEHLSLTIQPGDTLSTMIRDVVDEDDAAKTPAARHALLARVLQVNPSLKSGKLISGHPLQMPLLNDRIKLEKAASAPAHV